MSRSHYIDNVSAVMVLYMVFYHAAFWFGVGDSLAYTILYNIFFFFMPWFFFKSGMFAKEESLKDTFVKGFKSLIVPFLFWGFLSYAILSFPYYTNRPVLESVTGIGYTLFTKGVISGDNMPLWFLLTLFIVRLIFSALRKWRYVLIVVSFICAYVMSIYCHSKHFPLIVANTCTGLFFYSLGNVLRDYRPDRKSLIMMVVFFALCAIFEASHVDVFINTLQSGSYLLWIITSLMGILCINEFFHSCLDKQVLGLSYIGHHSMIIYVTHWPLYWIFNDYILEYLCEWGGVIEYLLLFAPFVSLIMIIKERIDRACKIRK